MRIDTLLAFSLCLSLPWPLAAAETDAQAAEKKNALAPAIIDDDIRAEIVQLPPLPAKAPASARPAVKSNAALGALNGPVVPRNRPDTSALQPKEPGYATVLSGTLHDGYFDLGPKESPILIRGNLIVAENATVILHPGAVIHLRGDPKAEKPLRDAPDPTQSAALWVWGALKAEGVTGNPIEVANLEKTPASLMLYGPAQSRIDGVRLKNINVTQTDGVALWSNCEFVSANHYALAGGAGIFTHCTFKSCGGVFATYNAAPWSLLMRRNVFDGCKEGIVLGSDPGETRLVVEKNHFLRTRGANIRAMPLKNSLDANSAAAEGAKKPALLELFIGENWYGSALLEEVEPRLVDRRIDPSVAARLNTRPPAERPYANVGAGVPATVLSATQKEQEAMQQKLLQAHPQPQASRAQEKTEAAAMSRGVKKPK